MSGIVTGRVFWTELKDLSYNDKNGKQINIKETTAKIVLLAIADSANDFGDNSWQSFETIATKASIERRSVIRVVRALLSHGYLKVENMTKYGTHNFSVNMEKLGTPPNKYAKVGRPKIGDPDAKIGDPDAKIGDPQSPYPLTNHPVNPDEKAEIIKEANKKVDAYLQLLKSPGLKKQARIDAILSYLAVSLNINTETKRWKEFAEFAELRQKHGEDIERFTKWLTGQEKFDIQFWSPARMKEFWPQAFTKQVTQPQTKKVEPEQEGNYVPNPNSAEIRARLRDAVRRVTGEGSEFGAGNLAA